MNAPHKSHIPTTEPATVRVVHPLDGAMCKATATENLWVGKAPFSNPSEGNEVTALTTGKAYFSELKKAIGSARTSIYIIGWQVSWDGQLDEHGTRLFDVLLNAAGTKPSLKIYVLAWDDTAPVQTYDTQTKAVLETINTILGRTCVFVSLTNSKADADTLFFSHHQKQVVIDEDTAFVGGMDLAYGRFCDKHYDLHADAAGRKANNRYNSCIPPTGTIDKSEVVDPDLLTGLYDRVGSNRTETIAAIRKGAYQVLYAEDNLADPFPLGDVCKTLDAKTQPRMPWQDVQVKIKGPAVADLALNFVLRWNTESGQDVLTVQASSATRPAGSGSCMVQVLRSASRNMCECQYPLMKKEDQERFKKPLAAQANIADAMKILISKAEHFIYIENQFFISEFGQPSIPATAANYTGPAVEVHNNAWWWKAPVTRVMPGDSGTLPQNQICKLLAERINHFIICEPNHPFHVYITLPVHPEGPLDNGIIVSQVHWTMQTLTFGSHSLLNRIRRSIMAKKLLDRNDPHWRRAYNLDINSHEFDDKETGATFDECFKYVTLLNLRNWEKLGAGESARYVTEQIYPHNKMMIVDDRYALLGTANINDRSMLGNRDSEIDVLIMDTKTDKVDLCGDGKKRPVRNFVRQLRMDVWNKIFGITGGKRAATELKDAVKHPGAPASWKKIQEVATKNTELYEAAFDFIPRSDDAFGSVDKDLNPLAASIWPTRARNPDKQAEPAKTMPFEEKFWTEKRFNAEAAGNLENVKGFITLLPYRWTQTEDNNMQLHGKSVAENTNGQTIVPQGETKFG